MQAYLTAPEYARRLGVKADKVRGWIARGLLRAINVSDSNRPRWRIPTDAIEDFERHRSPKTPNKRTKRKTKESDVIEFF